MNGICMRYIDVKVMIEKKHVMLCIHDWNANDKSIQNISDVTVCLRMAM